MESWGVLALLGWMVACGDNGVSSAATAQSRVAVLSPEGFGAAPAVDAEAPSRTRGKNKDAG